MPEATEQATADRVNLGPHQMVLEVADETGTIQRFVAHRPTLREQLRIGVEVSMLITPPTGAKAGEAAPVGEVYQGLAEAVATLNGVLDKRPAGLPADVGDWRDATLTWNLFTAFGEWLDQFRLNLLPAGGADSSPQ